MAEQMHLPLAPAIKVLGPLNYVTLAPSERKVLLWYSELVEVEESERFPGHLPNGAPIEHAERFGYLVDHGRYFYRGARIASMPLWESDRASA